MSFPTQGKASTYADMFEGRQTANGDSYSHAGYTAALLPRSNWYALPMGTRLRLTYTGRSVIVKVNDRGKGKQIAKGQYDETRVLDLSRAAYAFLTRQPTAAVTDRNASIIELSEIAVVAQTTALGPVNP
jgi:rare lipoprotein A